MSYVEASLTVSLKKNSSPAQLNKPSGHISFGRSPKYRIVYLYSVVRIKSTQKSKWACRCSRTHTNTRTSRTPEQRRVLSLDVSCGSRSASFNCSIPYLAVFYFCISMGVNPVWERQCIEKEIKEDQSVYRERWKRRKTETKDPGDERYLQMHCIQTFSMKIFLDVMIILSKFRAILRFCDVFSTEKLKCEMIRTFWRINLWLEHKLYVFQYLIRDGFSHPLVAAI